MARGVAAIYAGNAAAADAFRAKTGIDVCRWDVGSSKLVPEVSERLRPRSGQSISWSIMPGSSATAPCISREQWERTEAR
jgi:hypothetical protein